MSDETLDCVFAELDALLEEERQALRLGDYENLEDILARKEEVASEFQARGIEASHLIPELQEKVHRNQALLDQALAGFRASAQRISALHRLRRSLDTYDAQGQRQTITRDPTPTVEKRS